MDFAKNVRIKSYSEKFRSGRLCGDGVDRLGRTNSHRYYNDLIAKQAAKMKEQAATVKELMLELELARQLIGTRSAQCHT